MFFVLSIRRWTYVRYCLSAMAQELFLTGPGGLKRLYNDNDDDDDDNDD